MRPEHRAQLLMTNTDHAATVARANGFLEVCCGVPVTQQLCQRRPDEGPAKVRPMQAAHVHDEGAEGRRLRVFASFLQAVTVSHLNADLHSLIWVHKAGQNALCTCWGLQSAGLLPKTCTTLSPARLFERLEQPWIFIEKLLWCTSHAATE